MADDTKRTGTGGERGLGTATFKLSITNGGRRAMVVHVKDT